MNNSEAREILERELAAYRARPHRDLVALLDETTTTEVRAPSGVAYQVEIQVVWDDRPGEALRVLGSVDDGGWRAFVPLTDSFLVERDGSS